MLLVGLFLALSLFDIWLYLPGTVHVFAFTFVLVATAIALWTNMKTLRWPSRDQALRRLETQSGLAHRPLSTFDDDLVEGDEREETKGLWQAYKKWLSAKISNTRLKPARSKLPERDPYVLRIALLLLLFIAGVWAGPDWKERLSFGVKPSFGSAASRQMSIDAWVNPPAYTKTAPVFLSDKNVVVRKDNLIRVPQDSELTVRLTGGRGKPKLELAHALSGRKETIKPTLSEEGRADFAYRLTDTVSTTLNLKGRKLDHWNIEVIPDRPPAIAFSEDVKPTETTALEIPYAVRDDYGVIEAALQVRLTEPAVDDTATGTSESTKLSEEIIKMELPLPAVNPTRVDEIYFTDLSAHPWAGLSVNLKLVAIDELGQIGRSETFLMKLPERIFLDPFALAIIEQRRNLARAPKNWPAVEKALEALTLAPEKFIPDLTIYLGLRSVYWSLRTRQPETMSELNDVYELMWDLALRLEDGERSLAARELRAVQQALMDALARGAPQNEVDRLFEEFRQALDRYLQALGEQALEDLAEGRESPQTDPDQEAINRQDLQDLLDAIRDMSQTGDRQQARELLAQLQRLLENMVVTAPTEMSPVESQLSESIENLSDMIGKQRALMDETHQESRKSPSARSMPPVDETPLGPPQGQKPSSEGESGEGDQNGASSGSSGTTLQSLSKDQGALRQELSELLDKTDQAGEGAPNPLERAEQAMKDAQSALDRDLGNEALAAQKRALDHLRQGAQEMAEDLMDRMTERGNQSGQTEGQQTDPLGRPAGGANPALGDHIKVPDERDLQRAREILKELQDRAAERDRPDLELEYLERLLKRF